MMPKTQLYEETKMATHTQNKLPNKSLSKKCWACNACTCVSFDKHKTHVQMFGLGASAKVLIEKNMTTTKAAFRAT